MTHFSNPLLTGQEHSGGGGQGPEGAHRGVHGQGRVQPAEGWGQGHAGQGYGAGDPARHVEVPTAPKVLQLRYPDDDMSPKWKKSRKCKAKDTLKQATIIFRSTSQVRNNTSDEGDYVPSGGPLCRNENERGCKRGRGDQMEGPVGKKRRE